MLKRLVVSNFAVVEKAEVEFSEGLNVLTGETGAGKSVLMGALELVLGGRADARVLRDGAVEAEVEVTFDDASVRRTVTAQGRSRAWINDESVSIAELKAFCANRVDIHGPRANQRLLEERFQRETLDAFGDVDTAEYAACHATWVALKKEAEALASAASEDEIDLLRYQVGELEEAHLTASDETLAERHAAAAHGEEIIEDANAVTEALGGDRSAVEILCALQSPLRRMSRHLPAAETWSEKVDGVTLELQELSRTIADTVSKMDVGEESLAELDARLSVVNRLKRKYGATVAALQSALSEKKAKLEALENRDEHLAVLQHKIAEAEKELKAFGAVLTQRRARAAANFGKAVTAELRDLGFLQARFSVALEPCDIEVHGMDRVVYLFEPNPGESARALASIASSGEIARVMLALKSVLSAHDKTAVLVFDEIDANIGGEVGRTVGEKLRAVSRHHQVIAITHLPQSAVYGVRHFVVSKSVSGGRTRTKISTVEGEARVTEIARMLGGESLTSVVRKHAQELLELSR